MTSIKQELVHGIFWSAIEKYSGLIVSIIVSMILARLLSPAEYGVVAIATVIISFLQMFCTMGIGPAVIQKDLSDSAINSIYSYSLLFGLLLAILFWGSSWLIADFYANRLLLPVCQILCIQLFFAAINMVPNALMAKHQRFKDIAKRTLFLQVSSGILSIVAAWLGAGVYSLLISPVISSVGIYFWNRRYYKIKIDWTFNIEPIKQIFSYSSYQFLFEFVNYFSRNLDKLIIGKILNVDALGVYEKSYRLMQLPMQNVTSVINPVLQPVLRVLQNDKKELGEKYVKIIRLVATVSFPIGIILAGMSKEIIHIFYGNQWDDAIPIFSILALSLPLQMILSTSGAIYLVCNNTRMQFWLGLRNTITTVTGFLVAAFIFRSLTAMAWAWTITLIINFILTYWLMYRYVLCQSIIPFLKEFIHPTICGGILLFILFFLNELDLEIHLWGQTLLKGFITFFFTVLYIQTSKQYNLIQLIRNKFKTK